MGQADQLAKQAIESKVEFIVQSAYEMEKLRNVIRRLAGREPVSMDPIKRQQSGLQTQGGGRRGPEVVQRRASHFSESDPHHTYPTFIDVANNDYLPAVDEAGNGSNVINDWGQDDRGAGDESIQKKSLYGWNDWEEEVGGFLGDQKSLPT